MNAKVREDNTILSEGVSFYEDVEIGPFCLIGKPSLPFSNTHIGPYSTIRSHTIIYEDVTIGGFFSTGHFVTIREKTDIGVGCQIGSYSIIEGNVQIGDGVRTQSGVQVSPGTQIGDFVQIFPNVQFTNDPLPPSGVVKGITVEPLAVIATRVILLPGITVGMGSYITAGSVVESDVEPCMVYAGNPAKKLFPVSKLRSYKHGINFIKWTSTMKERYPEQIRGRLQELERQRNQYLTEYVSIS